MSDTNLIRLCKLPPDLGPAAGRELYLDPEALTFFVSVPPPSGETNGAPKPPVALAELLAAHPGTRDAVRTFVVDRMTGQPKAFADENREELDRMVAGITDQNRHEEKNWGRPVGREAW